MITVVGGVYIERCIQPHWNQLFGSAGRAAAALSTLTQVQLYTYTDEVNRAELNARMRSFGQVTVQASAINQVLSFDYVHPLSVPLILPPPHLLPEVAPLCVDAEVVLRFGMMEGSAVVRGRRVVYDPQSAYSPEGFSANGSKAEALAIVANGYEIQALTRETDPILGGQKLLRQEGAKVVVVKRGSKGALVVTESGYEIVPAYKSEAVFSIGSGDIFAAAFAYFWGVEQLDPKTAANLASMSTANYSETRSAQLLRREELEETKFTPVQFRPGKIYLAGPFFTLGERWLVEEAQVHLRGMGLEVFSPVHDVGRGPAEVVALADLNGLEECDRVLALVDGTDPGTLFEVGYARARNLPVIALAESLSEEQLKMLVGSGCTHTDDFATAIYLTAWAR
jgi:nucleoside 2-deoxyribosyltransferase